MAHENEEDEWQQQLKRIKTFYSSENPPSLSRESVIEILLRLPVKCLLRCMSVCKSWHSLIFDSHFVNSHLSLSTNNTDYTHHRLMLTGLKSCPLYDVIHDKTINSSKLDYPFKNSRLFVWIVGSCRGLLCLRVGVDGLYIWNPSTRISNKLRYCRLKEPLYGFGYDESSEDYKVVAVSGHHRNGTRVKMYSLKSAEWEKISDFPGVPIDDYGKFLNGALHWMTESKFNSVYSGRIVSFDLATKTYGEILPPVEQRGHMRVEALGEWLFLICYSLPSDPVVWMMKVYGDPDSWIKLVSIQNRNEFSRSPIPCFANGEKILLKRDEKHVLYDIKDGSFSQIENYGGSLEVQPWTYVESLVSPGGRYRCRYSTRRR